MPNDANIQPAAQSKPTKAKPRDKRTEMEKLRDQAAIMRLFLRGWNQKAIALELNVSEATVSRDMREVREALKKSRLNDLKAMEARELAKIDELEREAWAAWEASKGEHKTQVKTAQEGKGARAQIKTQTRTGDPRYLETVKWCISERAKLLGLYQPEKHDVTSGGEKLSGGYILQAVAVDYRQAIAALAPPADDEETPE